jgi:hypothetical protein
MADEAASKGTQAPTEGELKDRLRAAGFSNEVGYWREPNGGERLFTLDGAIAALNSGEIQPRYIEWPGTHPDTAPGFQSLSEEEMDRKLGRNQPEPEPPPLPSWAEPWAELIAGQLVDKLKPVIRAEVRAALRANREKPT